MQMIIVRIAINLQKRVYVGGINFGEAFTRSPRTDLVTARLQRPKVHI